ncbi:MAG: hypothetical protein M3Y27_24595, partial [Acidobacteriota bacterium]|nr:hypothetical protein [Acidobacteriota bacterium]
MRRGRSLNHTCWDLPFRSTSIAFPGPENILNNYLACACNGSDECDHRGRAGEQEQHKMIYTMESDNNITTFASAKEAKAAMT